MFHSVNLIALSQVAKSNSLYNFRNTIDTAFITNDFILVQYHTALTNTAWFVDGDQKRSTFVQELGLVQIEAVSVIQRKKL